ncbi:heterokaryon incompatibility protein-domain-containing protein [Paraphoma chrysanthemicola]|uniref:Heterokaryon incompatibility protein-domain-containing protein n=1 Tax=Paraphoma chrysanthemicola TaxID=798071 RepID=A0A8K0QYT9_9PLEO|nr:heterokaryon incompatibility protein-domain-containing protein [Paraphoma chrysanthemicola]
MADGEAYTYTPLAEPDKDIRLIRILSTTSQIRCQFSVVSLADSPIFTALSYAWGDATATEPVTVDGGTIHVTVNLANALRDIYGHWSKGDLLAPGHEQWLWADALCIDQSNVQEKNHQVPFMGRIYSNAYQVFAWLGSNDPQSTCKAIDDFNCIVAMLSQLPGYDYILEQTKLGWIPDVNEDVGTDLSFECYNSLTEFEWLERNYEKTGPASHCPDLNTIGLEPYWRRLWILQELVLAKSAILLCGSRSIAWSAVCIVYTWLKLLKLRHSGTVKPQDIHAKKWWQLTVNEVPRSMANIGLCRAMIAITDDIKSQKMLHMTSIARKLRYIVCFAATGREATDPKDFVYALGGMTGIQMTMDYSPDTTAAQVYHEFFSGCVLASKRLPNQDTGRHKAWLCDLWFLTMAGIGQPWNFLPGLPSWTPNLKGITIAQLENTFCVPLGEKSSFFTSLFLQDAENASLLGPLLCCTAYLLDEVTEAGPIIQTRDVPGVWSSSDDAWLLWTYATAVESTNVDRAHGLKIVAAIAQVLYDKLFKGSCNLRDLAVQLLLAEMENVCAKRGVTCVPFFESLGMLPPPFAVGDLGDDPSPRILWVAVSRCPGIKGTAGEQWAVEVSPFVLDNERQRHKWNGCKLALTVSGLVGLFPPLIQDGDILSVIHGYKDPVVLRRHRDGCQFVGACRIPALANEETVIELRESGLRTERIKIY